MCPVPNVTAAAQLLTVLAGAEMGTCVMLTCHVDVSCCMQRPTASSTPTDTSQDDVSVSEVTEVQAAVDLVQKQMRIYDGSFLQFRCDEKGFLSICAFGLPGKTHEDSPARAIQVHNLPVRPGLMPGPNHVLGGRCAAPGRCTVHTSFVKRSQFCSSTAWSWQIFAA